jgi:SNF2 family DNA or RNA helicase
MKEIFEKIVAPYTVRLRKDEVLPELPPKQYQRVVFSLPTEVQREYNRLAEEFYAELVVNKAPEEKAQVTAMVAISRITRLHQLSCGHIVGDDGKLSRVENGRFDALKALLDERPKGAKTIVWCHYRDNIDELMERLPKGSAVKIYGGILTEERTSALEAFQRGEASVLLANPAAAGWALTLTCADTAIYYSNSYNFEHRAQSEDRIHRIGQTAQKVMYYDIVAEGTVDERILDVLKNKQDFSTTVMRGLNEWLKQVL